MHRENGSAIDESGSTYPRRIWQASQREQNGEDHRPRCSQQHILRCQFSEWYPLFKHCTPRSVVINLPEDVVQYLQEDGVVLPQGFDMSCGEGVGDDHDDEVDWDEDEDVERVRHERRTDDTCSQQLRFAST